MENTVNLGVKEIQMPRLLDDSCKTREEIIAELELAYDQIKRGEGISSEELIADLTKNYGIKF